ncbi:MAG: sulfatase-like hydrolase/transferase, partial [Actinomycetota bacterium]
MAYPRSMPNIVWVFPDEWRHDAFGFAGNPVIRTPHIDSLARRGAVFRSAHCESPVCAPSRASLLTGRYCSGHGLRDNMHRPSGGTFPGPEVPTFLRALQGVGYRTAEFGKMHFFTRPHTEDDLKAYGFDEVSEEYDKWWLHLVDTPYTRYLKGRGLHEGWSKDLMESFMTFLGGAPGPFASPENLDPADTLDMFIGRQAAEWIRVYDREQPFFLWVAFVGPHMPYDGPRPHSDAYDPSAIPLGPLGFDEFPDNRWGAWMKETMYLLNCGRLTENDYRLAGKHYYGAASMIDEAVGGILRALADAGIEDETWIFVSSDHGEMLGDHGFVGKHLFYRSAVLVPQIVVPPAGHRAGITSRALTQGFDVPATM